MACPAPVIDVPLQSAPGRLFTVSRLGLESFVLTYSTSGSAEAPSVVSLAPFSDPAPEQWVDRDRH
jgi:hypothetical protein